MTTICRMSGLRDDQDDTGNDAETRTVRAGKTWSKRPLGSSPLDTTSFRLAGNGDNDDAAGVVKRNQQCCFQKRRLLGWLFRLVGGVAIGVNW